MKASHILSFVFILFFSKIEAQKIIQNKYFKKIDKKEYKIFLAPNFSNESKNINTIFYQTFNKDKFIIADTIQIKHNILNDKSFYESLKKTVYIELDDSNLKKNHNIYALLTQDQVNNFKTNSLGADILIIGSEISSKRILYTNNKMSVVLSGYIVVFDLSSGEFIYKIKNNYTKKYDSYDANIYPLEEYTESLFECLRKNLN